MIWMRSRLPPIGSFSAATRKVGDLPCGAALQVAAHRHALGVADRGGLAVIGVAAAQNPSRRRSARPGASRWWRRSPCAASRPRSSRACFPRPHGGVAGGADLPVHDFHAGLRVVHEGRGHAMRAGLLRRGLAEEIVLLERGEAGVRVGAADEAELVGVRAELLLELEAVLQRRAGIFEFEHLLRLRHAAVEVALVPDLVVGELVVRREEGMRLAVALHLRRLVEPLPLRALLGILAVDRLPNASTIGNIVPLLRLPLCAMASTLPPVFFS